MSPRVVTPTMSAENGQRHNVAEIVTGFKAGSHVSWRVAAGLPSHIHDSSGHYSDGGNGRILRKKWFVYVNQRIWYLFCDFLAPNHTITEQFSAKPCRFFLYVQKNQLACRPDTTCRVVWHGLDDRIWRPVGPTFQTFSQHVCMLPDDMSFGGSGNTTRCRHFQLRSPLLTLADYLQPSRFSVWSDLSYLKQNSPFLPYEFWYKPAIMTRSGVNGNLFSVGWFFPWLMP